MTDTFAGKVNLLKPQTSTMTSEFYKTNVTLRITALWAFSEAFMGGILHGLKIPFAGLVLSFVASVCITLIALGNNKWGEIIKATLLVIVVKFILSPHTPPMAYLAVLIQGLVGELLFFRRSALKPAAFVLTLFSLMYSAFQHLVILTIIFGKGFWEAIDIFLNKITKSFVQSAVYYSLYLILFYLACYLVAGIVGGWLNIKIIKTVQSGAEANSILQQVKDATLVNAELPAALSKGKRKKWFGILFGSLMLLLLVCSYLPLFSAAFSTWKIAELILRAIIIMLVWHYLITPLLRLQLKKWVARYKEQHGNQLQQVMALLPGIKTVLAQSWQISRRPHGWLHFKYFIMNAVLLIVYHEE